MSKKELIKKLKEFQDETGDIEIEHSEADDLLIEYINDPEIKEEYDKVPKWYA